MSRSRHDKQHADKQRNHQAHPLNTEYPRHRYGAGVAGVAGATAFEASVML